RRHHVAEHARVLHGDGRAVPLTGAPPRTRPGIRRGRTTRQRAQRHHGHHPAQHADPQRVQPRLPSTHLALIPITLIIVTHGRASGRETPTADAPPRPRRSLHGPREPQV